MNAAVYWTMDVAHTKMLVERGAALDAQTEVG